MQFHFKIADAERDRDNVAAPSNVGANPHAALQPQQPVALVEPKDAQHEIRLQLVDYIPSTSRENDKNPFMNPSFAGTSWPPSR